MKMEWIFPFSTNYLVGSGQLKAERIFLRVSALQKPERQRAGVGRGSHAKHLQ